MAKSGQPTTPILGGQLKLSDLQEEGLPFLNAWKAQIENQVNKLSGATGPTQLPAGVDVKGSTVSNIGEPQSPTDAISKGHAEKNYSAEALAPKLESGSKTALKSYRQLNSKQQRESYSDFLESCMSTAPTTNTSSIAATGPVGGSATVTISAGSHQFVSGNQNSYAQRSDTLSLPSSGQSVYYYYLEKGSQTLAISPPYPQDSQQARLSVNQDGAVLVAVAAINSSGLIAQQSAAGTTPPSSTGNFRLLTRL
jgi:hypothetical protein